MVTVGAGMSGPGTVTVRSVVGGNGLCHPMGELATGEPIHVEQPLTDSLRELRTCEESEESESTEERGVGASFA